MARRRHRRGTDIQGLLVVDKPVGLTSHDVVQEVRRIFGIRQVGHTGTLDPVASGVLVLMLGSATRVAQFLQQDDKEYRLSLRLGVETDTQDVTGQVISETDPVDVTRQAFEAALARYRGSFMQTPPAYSAVKKNGQPLYRLARQGLPAVADPREVTIHDLSLFSWEPPVAGLMVRCSKGTYMRTLCHDVGRDLGVGACMESLVRTRSGACSIEEALDLAVVRDSEEPVSFLKPTASGLPFPTVELPESRLKNLLAGMEVAVEKGLPRGMVSVVKGDRLLAVAEIRPRDGFWWAGPRKVLLADFLDRPSGGSG